MSYQMQQGPDEANQRWKHGERSAGSGPAPCSPTAKALRGKDAAIAVAIEYVKHRHNSSAWWNDELARQVMDVLEAAQKLKAESENDKLTDPATPR